MASPADSAVHQPNKIVRKKKLSGQQKREDLEREVAMLRKMLDHQHKVHEIMERIHHRNDPLSSLSIPNFLPPKAKELFTELAMVEDEISRLETQISQLQTDLRREKEINKEYKFEQSNRATLNNQRGFSSVPSPKLNPSMLRASERVPFETKSLHFISKAIKGDSYLNDFSMKEKSMGNLSAFSDHKENNFHHGEVGIQQLDHDKVVSRKSGLLKPVAASPFRDARLPSPRRQSNVEASLDPSPKPIASPIQQQSEEESIQKWPPNKLAESIMKCLIFIFVRLLRTSRAMELEKSGAISRSANFPLNTRSFRVDTSSNINPKASNLLHKESRQQDPYGIFYSEESIPRDIGPYKNLVMFTARNLEPKCISSSSSIPLIQKLRILMTSLQIVDLRFLNHQQKLAFWINMYNACVMHGFLQYGVPSSSEKLLTLMNKATLNIGGNIINAHTIEHFILRKPASSIFKEVYRKGDREDKEVIVRELYGLESSDPNVTFALCSGTRSSPAVRIYTPDGVLAELEKSKLEYLQASIVVTTSSKRIALPELLVQKMHDFAKDMDSLVEWVCHQLPTSGSLRKSMVDCFRSSITSGGKVSNIVDKIPYDFEFQYLLYV